MRTTVRDEEIDGVSTLLKSHPCLLTLLDSNWVNRVLLQKIERIKAHALLWFLLDPEKCSALDQWLGVLRKCLSATKFQGLMNKLKTSYKPVEFYSLLSEVEVLAYYAAKPELEVEYEPTHGDIRMIAKGQEAVLEVARLFSSEKEAEIENLTNTTWGKLDELENNKYILTFGISSDYTENDISKFLEFAQEKIALANPSGEKLVFSNGKAWLKIFQSTKSHGYVGGMLTPIMSIKSAGRLKNKILDEAKQLPKDHLNIVVYNISHVMADFEDIEDAVYGQFAARIDITTNQITPTRNPNGVIHTKEGEKVSAIIAFKDGDYARRKIYENPNAKIPLSREAQSIL